MDILVTGSVAYDYLMTFPGHFKEHLLPEHLEKISLSFLVESLVRRRGGIAPNIAYTLALLGGRPRVLATVGEDFADYRAFLEEHGVDTANIQVVPGTYTASFFATTDRSNAQVASFYPGAMAHAGELSLHELQGPRPEMVIVSPNEPGAMQRYIDECKALSIPYIYDPSQQIIRFEGDVLRAGVESAHALFANEYEFELIKDKTKMSADEILSHLKFMAITMGPKGALVYVDGEEKPVEAFPTEHIVDPTGGGDAFRGGFLTGYRMGLDWDICAQIGSLAATYCLENEGPQAHHFTPQQFLSRYEEFYKDASALHALIPSH
ncbi:MAG: carbohydrate kinase family protein [Anaerolineales bacterium]|nr:carbohydrate kinase family protein [Anaerolineales bacterium]MCW5856136.1 carbohydrate kinase family protein [Anaerolineales bacterium]